MATGALEEFLRKKEEIQAYKRYLEKHYPKVSEHYKKFTLPKSMINKEQHANFSSALQDEAQFRARLPHTGENI